VCSVPQDFCAGLRTRSSHHLCRLCGASLGHSQIISWSRSFFVRPASLYVADPPVQFPPVIRSACATYQRVKAFWMVFTAAGWESVTWCVQCSGRCDGHHVVVARKSLNLFPVNLVLLFVGACSLWRRRKKSHEHFAPFVELATSCATSTTSISRGLVTKQDNVHMNTESVQCISIVYRLCSYKYNQ